MLCIIAWNGQTDRAIRAASCLSTTCPLHSQTLGVTLIFRHTLASLFSPQASKCTRTTGGYCRSHTLTSVQMQWLLTFTLLWTSSGTVKKFAWWTKCCRTMASSTTVVVMINHNGQQFHTSVVNRWHRARHWRWWTVQTMFHMLVRFIAQFITTKYIRAPVPTKTRACEPVWKHSDTGLASNLAGQI